MIGIFGGTFDPIHKGHILLAEQALAKLKLDEVQLMPCANPVHRQQPRVEAIHRLKMLEIALAGYPALRINSIEIDRGGPSYMVDSLAQIARQQKAVLCLLVGVDAFNQFPGWKSPGEILDLAHLIVCGRPGQALDQRIYPEHRAGSVKELEKRTSGLILSLDIDECSCSSTEVRQLLAEGHPADKCLLPEVMDYIKQHHLYEKNCE
ncbi:MAG: nicotinate-nucleotide adenylyltransferase [Gammaproteobacteria bacterium]|nr:nicotinate-nucleotide adenylyltransferase [Gammaproteobacteria bacterium]